MSFLKKTGQAAAMTGRVINGVVTLGGSETLREASKRLVNPTLRR